MLNTTHIAKAIVKASEFNDETTLGEIRLAVKRYAADSMAHIPYEQRLRIVASIVRKVTK